MINQWVTYQALQEQIVQTGFCTAEWITEACSLLGLDLQKEARREGMAVLIGHTLHRGLPEVSQNVLRYFQDADEISEQARPYVSYVLLRGILSLTWEGVFAPRARVSCAEVAGILKYFRYRLIDLLTTNDIHGKAEVMVDHQTQLLYGGMETIGGIIRERRSLNPEGTFIFDGGDSWQGTLLSNTTNGRMIVKIMESLHFDASVLGNHDFDFGMDALKENIDSSQVPFLAANLVDTATGQPVPWVQPSVILERSGLRVGVIGFVTTQTPSTTKAEHVKGIKFIEPVQIAPQLVSKLRAQGCQLIILLSHQGVNLCSDPSEHPMGELVDLANCFEKGQVDAIIGGHVHQRFAEKINDIPVVIAQSFTQAVGRIQLFFDTKEGRVVESVASVLETYTHLTDGDFEIQDLVRQQQKQLEVKMNQVISETREPLWGHSYRFEWNGGIPRDGSNPLGDLIADALRAQEQADIAFVNVGTIRAEIEKAGKITYRDLYAILPLGNFTSKGTMTAQQVKQVLEVPDKYTSLPAMQFSGLRVEWDARRPVGDRYTKITLLDGTPLYAEGSYASRIVTVTTTDFMATGEGDGYTVFAEVSDWQSGDLMLDAWIQHLTEQRETHRFVEPPNDGRDLRIDLHIPSAHNIKS